MDFADYVNATVILYGIADNAMAGAVLRCGPSSHVYIDGLSQWSDSERYTALEVTGTLIEEGSDLGLRADDGTVMHGIGKHYVVKNATWKPISD
jgi:hypothetical protein